MTLDHHGGAYRAGVEALIPENEISPLEIIHGDAYGSQYL
jgi:hypothetical protein